MSEDLNSSALEPLVPNTIDGSINAEKAQDNHEEKKVEETKEKNVKLIINPKHEKSEMKKNWKMVPPDGGWGWLVLFGATLVNILVPGTIKSFGVLYVEFLEAFEASPSEAMWIPALCYFLYSSLGPISSILSVAWSYRTVTILGGICAAGGMIISFWASSVIFLYFSYGILVGTGAGLSFPPTVYIVTSYFVRLRGVANGICISGSAFGSILLPPLLRVLLTTYGYRGAVLLMGGITLNVFVAALFYDPVEKHMKREEIKDPEEEDEFPEDSCAFPTKFMLSDESMVSIPHFPHNDSFAENPELTNVEFIRSASSAAVQNLKNVSHNTAHRERKISMPTGRQEVQRAKGYSANSRMNSSSALHSVPEKQNVEGADALTHGRLHSTRRSIRPGAPKRNASTSSFQYISTAYHGSTLTLQPEIFASSFSLKSNSAKMIGAGSRRGAGNKEEPKKIKLFDVSLLRDPLYLIILISNATNAISYTNFIILLPSYAKDLGYDKDSGAMLLSIVSALDLVGRMGGSALSDLTTFPKCYYFVGGLFISGVSLAVMPFMTTYWSIAAFCSIFGLASGTYVGITAIVMADMLGDERLQSTYGISLFVNGVIQLIGPPLCGRWFEITKSFVSLFCSLGVILTIGSSLWALVPFIRKNKSNTVDEA